MLAAWGMEYGRIGMETVIQLCSYAPVVLVVVGGGPRSGQVFHSALVSTNWTHLYISGDTHVQQGEGGGNKEGVNERRN